MCESYLIEEYKGNIDCISCGQTFDKRDSKEKHMNFTEIYEELKLKDPAVKADKNTSKPKYKKREKIKYRIPALEELKEVEEDIDGRQAYLEAIKKLRGE